MKVAVNISVTTLWDHLSVSVNMASILLVMDCNAMVNLYPCYCKCYSQYCLCYLLQMLTSVSALIEVAVSRAASIFKAHMSVHVCKDTSQGVMVSIAVVNN